MNKNAENNLTGFDFAALWFGAAVSIAEIMTGGLLAPLGFIKGLILILAGHAIGTLILVLGGIIGKDQGIPSIMSTRISFGTYGSYIFSVLNILQLIGWTAVMIISGGRSLNIISINLWGFNSIGFWSIAIGILICLWIILGKNGFKKLNNAAVGLLFCLTLVLGFIVFKNGSLFTKKIEGIMSIGSALELNIIMPLSWLPLIADYTRFAKTKKGAVTGSFLGYFLGSSFMYTIGLAAAIVFENTDIGVIMSAANLGAAALFIVGLATITTTFLDANSAGVSLLNIFPMINEKSAAVFMAVLGTLIALIVPIEQYQNFLYAIGSVFAPLFAVLFTDYFIIGKQAENHEYPKINFNSTIVWAFGVIFYYIMLKFDFILGTTVPVMIITSVVYYILWRLKNGNK